MECPAPGLCLPGCPGSQDSHVVSDQLLKGLKTQTALWMVNHTYMTNSQEQLWTSGWQCPAYVAIHCCRAVLFTASLRAPQVQQFQPLLHIVLADTDLYLFTAMTHYHEYIFQVFMTTVIARELLNWRMVFWMLVLARWWCGLL